MKNILLMAVTLFMLAASLTTRAEPEDITGTNAGATTSFVGLWEGVDPEDGAHHILSITSNADGTFKLLTYATYFTRCNGGRGIVQGTGVVSAEQSLKVDDYTVTCFETGQTVKVPATFTLNSNGTLTEDRSASSAPTIIYHRTSK